MASFNTTVIARVAAALYDVQLGNASMTWANDQVNSVTYGGNVNALVQAVFARDFAGMTNAQVATVIVKNVGITTGAADAEAFVAGQLNAAGAANAGATIVSILNQFALLRTHPVAAYNTAAAAFNAQMNAADVYAQTVGSVDAPVRPPVTTFFNVTAAKAAGVDVMQLSGNQAVRLDFSNRDQLDQIRGLDLNGDGIITANGKENSPAFLQANNAVVAANSKGFEAVNAYARNPLDQTDSANNFLGSIFYDGTGNGGDGVNSDGNIVLGGFGADRIFGGIGNDFLAGGGVAQGKGQIGTAIGRDFLQGGRNADFMFVELSAIDGTDGSFLDIDGGETADNVDGTQTVLVDRAGTTNDRDWVLVEASDDDEATRIVLTDEAGFAPGGGAATVGNMTTRSGGSGRSNQAGIEAVDASGNLYGLLNDINVKVGRRALDERAPSPVAGQENTGYGSSSQLIIDGSNSANIVVAGYDNDIVNGAGGNDVLFGGNLGFLQRYANNPNLVNAGGGLDLNVNGVNVVTDGRDILNGGDDNDSIVFEAASGRVDGGNHFDTLFVTDFSVGRLRGTTYKADNAADQSAALTALTGKDTVIRLDLANGSGSSFRDYGGANRGLGVNPAESPTADQTNYVAALGATPASRVTNVEGVISTGLGDIDYRAAGSNSPELTFNNQQNFQGAVARFDVRGINSDALSTTKFGNYWTDANFGSATDGTRLTNLTTGGSGSATAGNATGIAFRDAGDNTIYLSAGNDNIEGRAGDDEMGGGRGDDNLFFDFGDGTDIVRRQADVNGDNLWDTDAADNRLFVQDFRADPSGVAATRLLIDFGNTDLTSANTAVGSIQLVIDPGKAGAIKLDSGTLSSLKSIGAIADAVSAAFSKIDSSITVTPIGNQLLVQDTKGRDISDTQPEGYAVFVSISNSSATTTATLNPGGQVLQENDRVLFVDYLARASNTLVDDSSAATTALGNQGQDLVVGLGSSTFLSNGQEWRIQFQNLQPGDKVEIEINGQKISGTVNVDTDNFISGQTTGGVASDLLTLINNNLVDIHTGAGALSAAQANVVTGSADEGVLVLTQLNVGGADGLKVYMNAPVVTITAANAATSSAAWALANTSDTSIELFNFPGRNGNLNADDVLFLGRTGQATLTTDKSTALLMTAKDLVNETVTGKDANTTTGANGDDQFISGLANDTFNGGTGDDRYIGSWGTDAFNGGGNNTGLTIQSAYTDSALFQESDFGAGTKFTVTIDAALGAVGNATVTAVLGTKTGVTTLTGVEEVRTTSNAAQDTIDFAGLSNNVAAATGASANLDQTNVNVGDVTGNNRNDGVRLNLTQANAGLIWAADRNNDDDTADSGEIGTGSMAVFGVENVIGGAANDIVMMDKTQLGSANNIGLAGQQPDLTPGGNFTEGRDLVIYDHASLVAASRPVLTVTPESAANTDTVSANGGVLAAAIKDILIDVEVLDVAAAATRATDVLDLTAIAGGATVNFTVDTSGLGQTVGKSFGGAVTADSVANVEANTLESGGISVTGKGLGNELLEIVGITQLDRVTGSAGNDRVILGDSFLMTNANFSNTAANLNFASFQRYGQANRDYATNVAFQNIGTYQFNLGAGDDTLDYRQTRIFGLGVGDDIQVVLDFTASDSDRVIVDDLPSDGATGAPAITNNFNSRVDVATGVERYFGATQNNANIDNVIDLSRAAEAVTVTFGFEGSATKNEYSDPNGTAATPVADTVTGIRVGTATIPAVAMFMEATALNGVGNAFWNGIQGSNQNETVLFSQYQDRLANEVLALRGGNNVVDYTAAAVPGQSDAYTLLVSDFTPTKNATTTHGGYTVTHSSLDQAGSALGTGVDTVSLDRQYDNNGTATDGTLTVIASPNSADIVDISALGAPSVVGGVQGTKFGSATVVSEAPNYTDIMGLVGGGHNRVDLGAGFGLTVGSVVQDVNLNVTGAETDNNAATNSPVFYDNVTTGIKSFDRITGSANNDRLFGNDSDNTINAGAGDDIVSGRGGGDAISLGAGGADRLVYTSGADTGHVNNPSITNNIATSFDSVSDFDGGGNLGDRLVIDATAGWGTLLSTKAVTGTIGAAQFGGAVNPGVILFTDTDPLTGATYTNMTGVVAALAGSATNAAVVTKGSIGLFALDVAAIGTAVYVYTASETNDPDIDANEIQLLTVLTSETSIDVGLDAAGKFTLSDLAIRYSAANGQQKDQSLVAGVREEIAYSSLAQSQYGAIDSFGSFVPGALNGQLQNNFVGGQDKIDLSAFNLGAQGALAINAAIIRSRDGAGNSITDANANDFFVDAGGIRRAVVIEFDNDDIDGGSAGTQGRARLFVDLNGDGQLSTTQDLFIDFATFGNGGAAVTIALNGPAADTSIAFGNNGVAGYADIIFGS